MDGLMDILMDTQINGWFDGYLGGYMDGLIDLWMGEWTMLIHAVEAASNDNLGCGDFCNEIQWPSLASNPLIV